MPLPLGQRQARWRLGQLRCDRQVCVTGLGTAEREEIEGICGAVGAQYCRDLSVDKITAFGVEPTKPAPPVTKT